MKKKITLSILLTCLLCSWSVADQILSSEISASASSVLATVPDYTANTIINGEGLWINQGNLSHKALPIEGTMWLSNNEAPSTSSAATGSSVGQAWVLLEFSQMYEISKIAIWNYNGAGQTDRGLYEVWIEYSQDGSTWTKLEDPSGYDTFLLNSGTGTDAYDSPDEYDHFSPFEAKYLAITAIPGSAGSQGSFDREAPAAYYGLSEVQLWHTGTNPIVTEPTEPDPEDGGYNVPTSLTLSCKAGGTALSHEFYLGSSFEEVNAADTSTPDIYLGSVTDPNMPVSSLDEATDYYWRVDAFDGTNRYRSEIWRFTTTGTAVDPNMLGWWKFDEEAGTSRLQDSSGRGYHADAEGTEFVSGRVNGAVNFAGSDRIILPKEALGTLDNQFSIAFWQYGAIPEPAYNSIFTASPIFNIHLPYVDTVYWDTPPAARVSQLANESDYYGQWNHWVFERDGSTGQSTIYLNGEVWLDTTSSVVGFTGANFDQDAILGYGSGGYYQGFMDDVRIYDKMLSSSEVSDLYNYRPPNAFDPSPGDTSSNVQIYDTLSWQAGDGALSHDVYFGTDETAVANATNTSPEFMGNQPGTTFTTALDLDTTYYWRVDEINGSGTVTGDVWSFTTADFVSIDDFEDYDDTSNLITNVWSGSVSVYEDDDYAGSQSMQAVFNSDISRSVSYSDWTALGVEGLFVAFHGTAGNTAQALTITLVDGNTNQASVAYSDNNAVVQEQWEEWIEWNIDLADFTGINLNDIQTIKLSMASGTILIDEIRLYPARCLPELASSDITGDCQVDITDFAGLANEWLDEAQIITALSPASGLRVWYKLDENSGTTVTDSSGNGYDGTLATVSGGAYAWEPAGGADAGSLDFDGAYITVPTAVFSTLSDQVTFSMWIESDGVFYPPEYSTVFHGTPTNGYPWQFALYCPNSSGNVVFTAGVDSNGSVDQTNWGDAEASDWSGQWNHYAFVKDAAAEEIRIYLNGVEVLIDEGEDIDFSAGVLEFLIGAPTWHSDPGGENQHFRGRLDDFRVYDVALTQAEIVSLAGKTQVTQPLDSDANLVEDNSIDTSDLAKVAEGWLDDQSFPY